MKTNLLLGRVVTQYLQVELVPIFACIVYI